MLAITVADNLAVAIALRSWLRAMTVFAIWH